MPQALRLILSPRGSAPALVYHAASSFNSCARLARTLRKLLAQRGDSHSPFATTRLATREHAAVTAARHRTVKERQKELHLTMCATGKRSQEAVAAMERPAQPRLSSLEGFSVRQSDAKTCPGDDNNRVTVLTRSVSVAQAGAPSLQRGAHALLPQGYGDPIAASRAWQKRRARSDDQDTRTGLRGRAVVR